MLRTVISRLNNILVCFILLLCGCESSPQLTEHRILQFGTIIDISLIHDDIEHSEQALIEIERRLQQYNDYWHAWQDSDLFRFNNALNATTPVKIPDSLVELITLSQRYYELSTELFNPAIGRLVAAYGFHGEKKADQALIELIQKNIPGMRDLKVDHGQALSTNPWLQLDFGGIAKGYAIALIADYLRTTGFEHFLINAGGDLLVYGNRFGKAWTIGVQNPFAPGAIASVKLQGDQYLFTSGNYQRFYENEDGITHHIIDPRNGEPSAKIASATVLSNDAVLADVTATTLMIDGWQNHKRLAESLGITDYLIVDQNLNIIVSKSLADKIEFNNESNYTIVN